jgi:hypothetical protein
MSTKTKYNNFVKYYGEMKKTLTELSIEASSFSFIGKPIPVELDNEVFRHTFIIKILDEVAREQFGKEPSEILKELNL